MQNIKQHEKKFDIWSKWKTREQTTEQDKRSSSFHKPNGLGEPTTIKKDNNNTNNKDNNNNTNV